MKIFRIALNDTFSFDEMCACIGYFDGMHVGHAALVKKTLKIAKERNMKSACITFDPDPWTIIKGIEELSHITSMEERISLGEQMGLDYWIIVSFTRELANMSTDDFEKMLASMNIKALICGFDYTYGSFGKGNVTTLKKQSYFDVFEVEAVTLYGDKISSTRIENEIEKGNMGLVSELLGRYYTVCGIVISGKSIGHSYGYPTANVKLSQLYVMPAKGVYIGYAIVRGNKYKCMINFGHNPSFNYKEELSVEAFLLDFNENIYDEKICLELVEKIRDEVKFSGKEELVQQLNLDILKAQQL